MRAFIRKFLSFTAVLFLLLLVLEAAFRIVRIPKISHHNILAKAQDLMPKIDSQSTLFLGDSRVEWGIKPKLWQSSRGEAYNMAFMGSNGIDILIYLAQHEIYPQNIIIGFTPNYGRYTNYEMDKMTFNTRNRIVEDFKYQAMENSYLYEKESVNQFIKGKKPYFIRHEYDDAGGVTVTESGNYTERKVVQTELYQYWFNDFKKEHYLKYLKDLSVALKPFRGKSAIYGLYMPTCKSLFELEGQHYAKSDFEELVDVYFDYSDYLFKDSLSLAREEQYFYDGSHLTPEYAKTFTQFLNKKIDESNPAMRSNAGE